MTLSLVSNLPKNENDLLSFGLDELAKLGARRIISQALILETEQYVQSLKSEIDFNGHQLVVKMERSSPVR